MSAARKSENTFMLKLSLSHAVVLLGLVLGGLTAAFFVGFRTGKTERFEEISLQSLEKIPRLPVPEDQRPTNVPKRLVSDVYAKLQSGTAQKESKSEVPDLEPVKVIPLPAEEDETLDDLVKKRSEGAKKRDQKAKKNEAKKSPSVKVAEQPEAPSKPRAEEEERVKVAEEKIEATPSKTQTASKTQGGLFELGNNTVAALSSDDAVTDAAPPRAPTQKENVAVPSEQGGLSKGWYVQLAAHEKQAEAESLVNTLSENGFRSARVQPALVRGKRYYRVLVGPEETTLLAQRLRDQLEREPYIKFKPYLKRVQ